MFEAEGNDPCIEQCKHCRFAFAPLDEDELYMLDDYEYFMNEVLPYWDDECLGEDDGWK
jgi:hypothetical protein